MTDLIKQYQREAKREVASALNQPLSSGDFKSGYDAAVAELQKQIVLLSQQIGEGCSKQTSNAASEYFENLISSFRNKLSFHAAAPQMPRRGTEIDVLPEGTRFISIGGKDGNRGLLVVEQLPQMRTIIVTDDHEDEEETYHLPMPYVCFVIEFVVLANRRFRFDSLDIAFRTKSFSRISDQDWFNPVLPNFSGTRPCMHVSTTRDQERYGYNDLSSLVEAIIRSFWHSKFGGDDSIGIRPFVCDGKRIDGFHEWEKLAKNSLDILKGKFSQAELHIQLKLDRAASTGANTVASRAWSELLPLAQSELITKSVQEIVLEHLQIAISGIESFKGENKNV